MSEKIFLCGTDDVKYIMESLYKDLRELGYETFWFHKKFEVKDKDTMETCLKNVKDSDRLILIISNKYGLPFRYTRNEGKISISEEEFLTAVEEGKKTLVFIEHSVFEQSKIYRKLVQNSDLKITEENQKDYGFKAQLETYAFIDRIQHIKKNGILDVRWIEPFRDIRDIMEQIELKWIYDEKEIFLIFMDDSIEFHLPKKEIKIYSEEEITNKKEHIKSEYLHISPKETDEYKAIKGRIEELPLPLLRTISEEDWQIYNECVGLFSEKYSEYLVNLNEYNEKMRNFCSLGFNLRNSAHYTLYDITAYIEFPEGLKIQKESLDDPPNEPKPPPKPKELALLFNNFTYDFGAEIRRYREELKSSNFSKLSKILSSINPGIILSELNSPFKILDDGRLRIIINRLIQNHFYPIPPYNFFINFKKGNENLKINWEIYIGNPSKTIKGELWLIFGNNKEVESNQSISN